MQHLYRLSSDLTDKDTDTRADAQTDRQTDRQTDASCSEATPWEAQPCTPVHAAYRRVYARQCF